MGADFRLGPWLVEPSLNSVSRNGSSTHLEPKVMEVLVCLVQRPGEMVAKDHLLRTVWPGTFVSDDALTRAVSELRRVLDDDPRDPRFIQTIPKRGYRLVAEVRPVNGAPTAVTSSGTDRDATPETKKWGLRAGVVATVIFLIGAVFVGSRVTRQWRPARNSAPAIRSVAVLPLQNLSGDPTQEYFSDGMTDALITDLAQIDSLKVISRTSSMQYKQTKKSLPEIARELNVDGIIEGTVQRSGSRVRITAQLIQGASDKHLWANMYERDARDVFELEQEVTADIARQILARLLSPRQLPPAQRRPVNPEAGGISSRQLLPE